MSINTLIFYGFWAALAGAGIPMMAATNGTLGRSLGSPIHASLVLVAVGAAVVLITFLAVRPAMPPSTAFASVPPFAWFGGIAMAFYALTATFLAPRFGVGNFVICVVVAQLVVSSMIDQFGLFGAPVTPISLRRAAGLAVLAVGAGLVAVK